MDQSDIELIEKLNKIITKNGKSVRFDFSIYQFTRDCVPKEGLSLPVLHYLLEMNNINIDHLFMSCCMHDNVGNLEYLLNMYHIDINKIDAMCHAVVYNNINVINFLLANGFDIKSNTDRIFFLIINNDNAETLLPYFLNMGLVLDESNLQYSITNSKIIKTLIDYGFDLNKIAITYFNYLSQSKTTTMIMENLSMLSSLGIDLNQYINNFTKN